MWAEHKAEHDDYFRKTAYSWFKYWTKDFTPANPPEGAENSSEQYASVSEAAEQAEAHLNSVDAIQQAIVAGLKAGRTFSNSHKEGGTVIAWRNGKYVRDSYGDDPLLEQLPDEASLLKAVWHFNEGDITRHALYYKISDLDMWKLIWRRMGKP